MITISTRLDEKILSKIEKLANKMNLQRSALIRKFILDGLQEEKLKENISLVVQGEMSIGQAVEDSQVSYYKFLKVARLMNAEIGLDETTLNQEFKVIEEHLSTKDI
jgi:metal-responsive CopG/Arc/MetJ family transcriptional regulator